FYLTLSWPDITFVIHKLSQFLGQPSLPHLQVVHHLLHYLKSTPSQGLFLFSPSSLQLKVFSNVDWGSCLDTRKSITSFYIFIGDS
ncbi:hypothetical protein VitviT2T_008610, partial [Vitis vinifera]